MSISAKDRENILSPKTLQEEEERARVSKKASFQGLVRRSTMKLTDEVVEQV